MPRSRSIIFLLVLAALFSAPLKMTADRFLFVASAQDREPQKDPPPVLMGEAQLIETKQQAEKVFKQDIVNHGLCAVILTLTNQTKDITFSLQRSNIMIRTEFDAQLPVLEPQRAYDRLMWKVGGGPAFAEYGIGRAIAEGSRKKKLQTTVLSAAIGPTVTLETGKEIEGALFFEFPKDTKTLQFSTLVVGEIINQKTGERSPLRIPLTVKP